MCKPLTLALVLALAGCDRKGDPASAPDPARNATPSFHFEDVTARAGVDFVHQLADGKLSNIMESDGAGGTVLDFDNDGWPDLYLVNSGPAPGLSEAPPGTPRQPNRLFRNRGDGTFEDVTQRAGVAGHGFGTTAAAADYDNDGDTDLYVVNFGGGILYQNQGDGTFKDVTAAAGLAHQSPAISATFFDADGDGQLDLLVASYLAFDPAIQLPAGSAAPYPGPLAYQPEFNFLYRNRGDGTFAEIGERAGLRVPGHRAMSVTSLDYDLDGDADVYVSNDATANLLLANDGHGQFTEIGLKAGVAFNQFGEAAGSMGAAVGDVNGDGRPDLLVTRFGNASLYLNSSRGFFEDRIQASGMLEVTMKYTGWGGNVFDFDNDGDLDVFIVNGDPHFMQGQPSLLLENDGRGQFTDARAKGGPFFATRVNARGSAVLDFDNDGWLDVVLTTLGDRAILLRNRGARNHHWIRLKLEGTRSNREGFGAQVRVTAGGRTQSAEYRCPTSYVFQQDVRLHFGLGAATQVERIEIKWPGGPAQVLSNLPADQVLNVTEPGDSRWTGRP